MSVRIRLVGFDTEVEAAPGVSLLAAVRSAGMDIDADCAGRGTCGLCAVRFLDNPTAAGADDVSVLGETAVAEGWRLSCQAYVSRSCTVLVPLAGGRGPLAILTQAAPPPIRRHGRRRRRGWGAAVDLGTSTVVAYLMDLSRARQVGVAAFANPQRRFGSDVISRILYAHQGPEQRAQLQAVLVEALEDALARLCGDRTLAPESLGALTVAGNPTMLHLLAGIDPWPLGVAPFEPVFRDSFTVGARDLGFRCLRADVEFLPIVAGHLGADAVAGIVALGLRRRSGLSLFVDLGTNGEMALVGPEGAVGCSCAAGPAFEGGHISHGMPALPGAVDRVEEENGTLGLQVIGGGPPRGICGSGLADLVALLLRRGAVSPSGRLRSVDSLPPAAPPYLAAGLRRNDNGVRFVLAEAEGTEVSLNEHDVRELQLAKAPVRVGIEVLLEEWDACPDDVEMTYLAGAFGSSIRPQSLLALGMLPSQLRGRIRPVGNVAGLGAKLALVYEERLQEARDLARSLRHVELMRRPDFEERFAAHLRFPLPEEAL